MRPKPAIYTLKRDDEHPRPAPGLYLQFCLRAEVIVLIQNLSDGANSYPSVQNKDQDLKRTNVSLTKVNKQINDKKEKLKTNKQTEKKTRSKTLQTYCHYLSF